MFPTTVAQYGLGCWDLFLETATTNIGEVRGCGPMASRTRGFSGRGGDASAGLQRGYSAMTKVKLHPF